MAYIDEEGVEHVDGEIVDRPPQHCPTIKFASPDDLSDKAAIKAPPPNELFGDRRSPRRRFQTPEQMQAAVDDYFASCIRYNRNEFTGEDEYIWVDPPTVPGLALALGFASSDSLLNYEKLDEFVDIVKEAKMRIEEYTAKALHKNPKATGLIFILKNMGWKDNRTVTYAPPSRLEAAKTPEQLAELISQDIVD